MNARPTLRPSPFAIFGCLLLLAGSLAILPDPATLSAQGAGQSTPAAPPATPTAGRSGQPAPPAGPALQPKLSILLLMDVSGSMGDNNKIAQAKAAAIQAIWAAGPETIAPGPGGSSPTGPNLGPSVLTSVPIPGIPSSVQQRFDRYLRLMERIQGRLGPDMKTWATTTEARTLGKVLQRAEALMQGLAFGPKSELMKRLSPMVEKMHYSLAGYVNQELGGGLKYVLSGKTASHSEFGGLFTLKKSDHDAIYLGAKSEEAKKLHQQLSREIFGEQFAKTTETCLESSRYTLEKVDGPFRQAFEKFTGPTSNLDWMRSPSGSKWVQGYVDRAGTVVDLDKPLDALDANRSYERQLSSLTDDELKTMGVSLDRRAVKDLGYNLGMMSDFERQMALNQHRHALEKGMTTLDAADDAMIKAKYGPRYLEVVQQAGGTVPPEMQKYVDEVVAIGTKAKGGTPLTPTEQAKIAGFDDFAKRARESALKNQLVQYQNVTNQLAQAGDDTTRAALGAKAQGILDDTQAAIHNYQQLYGEPVAKGIVDDLTKANKGMGDTIASRLQHQPWVAGEAGLGESAKVQLAAEGKLPPGSVPKPTKAVITDSQSLWQQVKQNPAHGFAKFAQYGGYAWMTYDVLSLIHEGKDAEALKTAATYGGVEASTYATEYVLSSKFGAGAGGWVALSALGGYMVGNTAANWMQGSRVDEMTLQMLSGYSSDGTKFYQGDGMLQALGASGRSDDDIMGLIKPGTVGGSTVGFDPNGNVEITKKVTKLRPMGHGEYNEVEVDERTVVPKSQILANQRLQEMFNVMRGKFHDAVSRGELTADERKAPNELQYEEPAFTYLPGSKFSIPNTGGLSPREYEFYKKSFEESWRQWSLGKAGTYWKDKAYWNNTIPNAVSAKWAAFRQMIDAIGQGKQRDREFADRLGKMHADELAALKQIIQAGVPFSLDGKKLTPESVQKMIEAREEEVKNALEKAKKTTSVGLPDDLKKLLDELENETIIPDLAAGNVEFAIMPYSGGCSSAFSLFAFTFDALATKSAIESLSAGGGTPMSPALAQAGYAIRRYGHGQAGTIILLCDGQNDCSQSPIEAAASISKRTIQAQPGATRSWLDLRWPGLPFFPALFAAPQQTPPAGAVAPSAPVFIPIDMNDPIPKGRENIPITVSTVGFQVTADQQKVLNEIAQAGGGIAGSGQNIAQLTSAFTSAIQQANLVTFASGGGGGVVLPASDTSWPIIALVGVLVGCGILALAIVVVRRRVDSGDRIAIVLEVHYADGSRKTASISSRDTTIGRGESNGIVLHDPEVSGRHAVLVATPEGIRLRDLDSSGGTFVNGQRITEQTIYQGDQIVMGHTRLVVQ